MEDENSKFRENVVELFQTFRMMIETICSAGFNNNTGYYSYNIILLPNSWLMNNL